MEGNLKTTKTFFILILLVLSLGVGLRSTLSAHAASGVSVAVTVQTGGSTSIPLESYSSIAGMGPDVSGASLGIPFDLGYINGGGYARYPLNVLQGGDYLVSYGCASPNGARGVNFVIDG